jgi:hypothetical protein
MPVMAVLLPFSEQCLLASVPAAVPGRPPLSRHGA